MRLPTFRQQTDTYAMNFLLRITVFAALLASHPMDARAVSVVETHTFDSLVVHVDKSNNAITFVREGSMFAKADLSINRVFLYSQNGQTVASIDLHEALNHWAGGNEYAAASLEERILRLLSTTMAPRELHGWEPTPDPYPCQMSPCPPAYNPYSNPWYTPSFTFPVSPYAPGMGPDGQPLIGRTYDQVALSMLLWRRSRQQYCDRAHGMRENLRAGGAGLGAIGACALGLPEGYGGWLICSGAVMSAAATIGDLSELDDQCHAPYPGYGN